MHLLHVISKYEKQIQASCNFNMVKIMAMAWFLAKEKGEVPVLVSSGIVHEHDRQWQVTGLHTPVYTTTW